MKQFAERANVMNAKYNNSMYKQGLGRRCGPEANERHQIRLMRTFTLICDRKLVVCMNTKSLSPDYYAAADISTPTLKRVAPEGRREHFDVSVILGEEEKNPTKAHQWRRRPRYSSLTRDREEDPAL